jgi:hypothetical protein
MENKSIDNVDKKLVVQAIIDKIEEENKESEIKTNLVEGYSKPEKIVREGNDRKGYVPDIISKSSEQTDLYEVELDPEKNDLVDKWKLFLVYTSKLKGKLNIVTPKSKLDKIKGLLKENQISAKIIYFA